MELYEEDEILSVDSSLSIGSFHYVANVLFTDEPQQVYEYINDDGKIVQAFPNPEPEDSSSYQHLEKQE
ncbi:hypothetical protein WMO40_11220 [Bacillaceae bacterium CLA-AA-H227]|uniref:Uncharacterized protein n=1 Tax=Robertmurraya yapensis (ex Hitch et al 2024) TaxID=3133160 RepID=A0ACC6SBF0_9BACI